MIDNFVLALTHGLMLLAAWRILSRPDLQDDGAPPPEGKTVAPAFARLRQEAGADKRRA
jgi:hypothetical protein